MTKNYHQENFNDNQETFEDFFNREKDLFCYHINMAKVHQKLTVDELSKKTGISALELEQYLIGNCDFEFEKMCRIANALGEGMEKLFQE